MPKKLLFTLILSLFTLASFSQKKTIGLFSKNSPSSLKSSDLKNNLNTVSSAQLLNLDITNVQILHNQQDNYELNVPTKNGEVVLEIEPFQILSSGFKVITPNGEYKMDLPTFYKGNIKGEKKSFVALTVTNQSIEGLISSEKVNLTVGKLKNTKENYHVVYNSDDIVNNTPLCAVESPPMAPFNTTPDNSVPQISSTICRAVDIYLEADYKMYTDWGNSVTNVVNTMTGIFNNVALLYDNEGVNIDISQLFVWTTTDPYASATSTSDGLTLLKNYWDANNNSFNGNIVHLVSTRPLGGGIAYLSGGSSVFNGMTQRAVFKSCDKSYAKGFSAGVTNSVVNIPTYSWNVNLIAHELGHNFGLPHTHSCSWSDGITTGTIDNCGPTKGYANEGTCANGPTPPLNGGTIMSYCHLVNTVKVNFANGFGPLPGAKLLAEFNAATCLQNASLSTLAITQPIAICQPSTVVLKATGCTGGVYNWYANAVGGTSLGALDSLVTPLINATTNYYVSCTKNACEFRRIKTTIPFFNNVPPNVTDLSICGTNTSVNLVATGCTGLSINWFSDSTLVIPIGTGSSLTVSSITNDSTFYANCSITGCGSTDKKPLFVNYEPVCELCIPTGLDCNSDDKITRFRILKGSIALIDSSSNCSLDGYSSIVPLVPVNLVLDSVYILKINKPVSYDDGVKVWIDYNKNNEFETTEIVYTSTVNNISELTSPNIIIPSNAKLGMTKMRVKLAYEEAVTNPCSITEGQGYGETEDYQINIICPESVVYPVNLAQTAGNYKTSNTIISSANVATGTNYLAGKHIILEAGFQAGGNETFSAKILGCQ